MRAITVLRLGLASRDWREVGVSPDWDNPERARRLTVEDHEKGAAPAGQSRVRRQKSNAIHFHFISFIQFVLGSDPFT